MDNLQKGVKDFMNLAGQPTPATLTPLDSSQKILRFRLIFEELLELADAIDLDVYFWGMRLNKALLNDKDLKTLDFVERSGATNFADYADAISDLLYVTYGAAVDAGIDIEPFNEAIWENNLSKFKDGYKDENGKWRKGKSYKPVDFKAILDKQTNEQKTKAEQLEFDF